jgi:hypothetical protein
VAADLEEDAMTTPLSLALDGLAHVVDGLTFDGHGGAGRAALGDVVARLERAAGADLGAADGDPGVVLVRRFTRAHGLLLADPGSPSAAALTADDVCALTRLLRGGARRHETGPAAPARVPVGV